MKSEVSNLGNAPVKSPPFISSAALGMLLFVLVEVMIFAGLISAFTIARTEISPWPPPNQPRLPVETTAANTAALLLSGLFLLFGYRTFSRKNTSPLVKPLLGFSIFLGIAFVALQGYEWVRLIQFGLTMKSSAYGSFFYLIIGAHALHAIIGLGILIYAWCHLRTKPQALVPAQIFWYFVVGLWPILYYLVYWN